MIINLTQHPATPDQIAAGVVDITAPADRKLLLWALTFDELPDSTEIDVRADMLANLAEDQVVAYPQAMIGGAPYLMAALERALVTKDIQPVYAFSVRESVEQVQDDGSVRKVNVFRHAGFVEAVPHE